MSITYNVYRDGDLIAEGVEETRYTDTGLTPNTTYTYEVSAVNEYGLESPRSTPITVTTAFSPVETVSLDLTSLELEPGQTHQLNVTVSPDTANQEVTWSSDNEEVATVTGSGLVKAVGVGTATITVTSVADSSKQATCTVTVAAPEPDTPEGLTSPAQTDTTVDLEWQ